MSAAHALQFDSISSNNVIGRSFVLGLPDRHGLYRIGLERSVWKIAAGAYATGDRVKVVAIDEGDILAVEKVLA
jgi:membrane protein implicated in regulation of membrane protease activity